MAKKTSAGGAASAAPPSLPSNEPDEIRRFQFTSLDANSNKWYLYEIYRTQDGYAHVIGRFGRVGDKGQTHYYGILHQRDIDRLVSERVHRKGYVEVSLAKVPTGQSQVPALPPGTTGQVVKLIVEEAGEAIQGYLDTTVDQLSEDQIKAAKDILERWGKMMVSRQLMRGSRFAMTKESEALKKRNLVEEYYRTIPTKLPRKIDPDELVHTFDPSEQEVRLQQLGAAVTSYQAQSAGATSVGALLGCELELVDPQSQEYKSLHTYIVTTATSRLNFLGIFRVTIPPERAAYKADQRGKGNRALLFHGTNNPNVRHILRSGLIVPRYAAHGRAFGDGIYFANKSQKSLNYVGTSSRGVRYEMMLISEVSLGKVYETRGAQRFSGPPAGYDSVKGVAHGGYGYDEIIVYSPTQSTVRYLVVFTR